MINLYAWIVLMTDTAADYIVAGLVRRGFKVEALSATKNLTIVGEVSTLCALNIGVDNIPNTLPANNTPTAWMREHIRTILTEKGLLYHAIVVTDKDDHCSWAGANIRLQKPGSKPTPPAPEPTSKTQPSNALDKIDEALR